MSCVTAIEGEWLAELGPMFFSVKESYKTRLLQKVRERENKEEMEKEMFIAEKRKEYDELVLKKDTKTASIKRAIAMPGMKSNTVGKVSSFKKSRIGF